MKRYPTEIILSNEEYLSLIRQRDDARYVLGRMDKVINGVLGTGRKTQQLQMLQSDIDEVLSDCGIDR